MYNGLPGLAEILAEFETQPFTCQLAMVWPLIAHYDIALKENYYKLDQMARE
jgi:hypothetical protein